MSCVAPSPIVSHKRKGCDQFLPEPPPDWVLRDDLRKQLKFQLKARFGPQLSNLQAGYSPQATCTLGGPHWGVQWEEQGLSLCRAYNMQGVTKGPSKREFQGAKWCVGASKTQHITKIQQTATEALFLEPPELPVEFNRWPVAGYGMMTALINVSKKNNTFTTMMVERSGLVSASGLLSNMLVQFWISLTMILLQRFWSFMASIPGDTLGEKEQSQTTQIRPSWI